MDLRKQYIKKQIGARIRERRLASGLTIDNLAEFADVSPGFLALIERGQRGASLKVLLDICDALQCSISDIVEGNPVEKSSAPIYMSGLKALNFDEMEDAAFLADIAKTVKKYINNVFMDTQPPCTDIIM